MISITLMPSDWGFGNRILFYNNLRQFAEKKGESWSSIPWEGHQYFVGDLLNGRQMGNARLGPCLGENFFEWRSIPTRKIFVLQGVSELKNTAAVHFRGGDFYDWNKDAILKTSYYLDAIDQIKDEVDEFIIFTDDENLQSYSEVEKHFEDNNIKYDIGDNDRHNYINDFKKMSECDYIISSPSTYCICAGFIGKQKKIIHSLDWINNRIEADDKFWVDLYDGGNDDYSIWRLV